MRPRPTAPGEMLAAGGRLDTHDRSTFVLRYDGADWVELSEPALAEPIAAHFAWVDAAGGRYAGALEIGAWSADGATGPMPGGADMWGHGTDAWVVGPRGRVVHVDTESHVSTTAVEPSGGGAQSIALTADGVRTYNRVFDGSSWTDVDTVGEPATIWGEADTRHYGTVERAHEWDLLEWDGAAWVRSPSEIPRSEQDGLPSRIASLAVTPDDAWAANNSGGLYHRASSEPWRAVDLPGVSVVTTVATSDADNVWVVGRTLNTTHIRRYDGAAWLEVPLPSDERHSQPILEVVAVDDVWLAYQTLAEPVNVRHWDGAAWSRVDLPEPYILQRIRAGADGAVWFVGASGSVSELREGVWTYHHPVTSYVFDVRLDGSTIWLGTRNGVVEGTRCE